MRKPENYRPLLTVSHDSKTVKGEKMGYLTGILYLAPANEAGRGNVCPMATQGCKSSCLYTAGRAQFTPSIIRARVSKTHYMFDNQSAFIASLRHDINKLQRRAAKLNLIPCVRVNGTSDLAWLGMKMASEFPSVQFYDYTKLPKPWQRTRENYHITFSHSESNEADCIEALQHGINVAVVFDVKRGKPLPASWHGYRVIDGDLSDLRFLDAQGVVVGLRAKGKAKKDCSGFVVKSTGPQLVSIAPVQSQFRMAA